MNIPKVLAPLKLPEGASSMSSPPSPEPKSPRKSSPPLLMGFALGMRGGGGEEHVLIYAVLRHFSPNIKGCIPMGEGRRGAGFSKPHTHPRRRTRVFYVVPRGWLLCLCGTERHRSDPSAETGPFQILKPYASIC